MFYEARLLNICKNGRFSHSWIAATCPMLFRRNCKKDQVLQLSVHDICQKILETWTTESNEVTERFSLYLVSQLLYGTVCIYQQQVQFLYESVATLLSCEKIIIKQVKRTINTNDSDYNPKRRKIFATKPKQQQRANENEINMDNVGVVFNDSRILQPLLTEADPSVVGNNDEITLRENNVEVIENRFDNDFPAVNENEFDEFLRDFVELDNIRKTVTDGRQKKRTRVPSISNESENLAMDRAKVPCYDIHKSSDKETSSLSYNAPRADLNVVGVSTITSFHQTHSTPLNTGQQNIRKTSTPFSIPHNNPLIQITNLESLTQPASSVNIPSIVENLAYPTSVDMELINSNNVLQQEEEEPQISIKRKPLNKKKNRFIDIETKMSDAKILSNFKNVHQIMRCQTPIEDCLSLWLVRTSKTNLFTTPSHRIQSSALIAQFKRNLSTKTREIDPDLLEDFFTVTEIDYSLKQNASKKRNQNQPTVILQDTNPHIELPEYNQDIPNNIPETTNLNSIVLPENETVNPDLNEINLNATNTLQFAMSGVYENLILLWSSNEYPINIRSLCANVKNKSHAAIVFNSLLYLQKDGLVELTKKEGSLEIYHIAQGKSIMK